MTLVAMKFGLVAKMPDSYHCALCGAIGLRLWRRNKELTSQDLFCFGCVLPLLGMAPGDVDESGRCLDFDLGARTLRLRDAVPAIPDKLCDNGSTHLYMEFRRITQPALRWWEGMPLK
jgi:hypothetical protein